MGVCSTEKDAMVESRRLFGRAYDHLGDAAKLYAAGTIAEIGTGATIIMVIAKRASPISWAVTIGAFIGSVIGAEVAEDSLEQATEDYNRAEDRYNKDKAAYCSCVLSSLPDNAG